MNRAFKTLPYVVTLLSASFLGACVMQQGTQKSVLLQSDMPSDGVVVAEAASMNGVSAFGPDYVDSDCPHGKGLGVVTRSTRGEDKFLFDQKGKPCTPAVTLFDGQGQAHARPADPAVNIAFVDRYGTTTPTEAEKIRETTVAVLGDATLPEEFSQTGEGNSLKKGQQHLEELTPDNFKQVVAGYGMENNIPTVQDFNDSYQKAVTEGFAGDDGTLQGTVNEWEKAHQRQKLVKNAEKLIAGARGLERKSANTLMAEHQMEIQRLLMRLREAERMNAVQRERERQLKEELISAQAELSAAHTDRTHVQKTLEDKVVAMTTRAREFEVLARELKEDKSYTEEMLSQRIIALKGQLSQAEKQADATQQELLLEAAQQLAQAERSARIARASKRLELERLAEKKQNEAVYLAEKARQLEQGYRINLPAFQDIADLESPEAKVENRLMVLENRLRALETPQINGKVQGQTFEDTLITLHAQDLPLSQIMENVLEQLNHLGGPWKASWELSAPHAGIMSEKWTVVAEATLSEFLAYVKEKVQQVHGAELQFHRFDDNRMFVMSDENSPY